MTDIYFKPFIGEKYHNSHHGVRLLVLGESHYGDIEDLSPDYTQHVVTELAFRPGSPFFTKTTKLLRGLTDEPSIQERQDTWQSIAFYNYIQEFVGNTSRIRPTPAMWQRSAAALKEVFEELRPDVILVLGYQMRDELPDLPVQWAYVKHPSGGMSYTDAIPELQKAIAQAR